jgi:osmotically-inducible protein OsmY
MRSDQVKSSSIKVVTENGVIYLMGLISQEKAKEALRLTSEIGGAVKVVSVLEYTD